MESGQPRNLLIKRRIWDTVQPEADIFDLFEPCISIREGACDAIYDHRGEPAKI